MLFRSYEQDMLTQISNLTAEAYASVQQLESALSVAQTLTFVDKLATHYRDEILPAMQRLRTAVDQLECIVSTEYWPMPTYGDLLFGV